MQHRGPNENPDDWILAALATGMPDRVEKMRQLLGSYSHVTLLKKLIYHLTTWNNPLFERGQDFLELASYLLSQTEPDQEELGWMLEQTATRKNPLYFGLLKKYAQEHGLYTDHIRQRIQRAVDSMRPISFPDTIQI